MKKTVMLIVVLASVFIINVNNIDIKAKENHVWNFEMVQPKKDVLVWRYKNINGKLYKRLYNATKKRWESDWIVV